MMIERSLRMSRKRWRPAVGVVLGALVCLVIVMVVPHDVDRVLIPGELMLLSVVIATVAGGRVAGGLVLAGSAVALLYYFVPDPDSFMGGTAADYLSVLLYLLVGAVLIAAVSSLIITRDGLRKERVRLQSLIDLSTRFDLELDADATLRGVARAVVSVCDVCVVDVLERGRLRRAAATTRDREFDLLVDNLLRHAPLIDNPSHPAVVAITTRKPVVLDRITADVLDAATDTPNQRRATAFLQGGSAIVVPILANREALGSISLVRTARTAQPFDAEEVAIAIEIAARAGEALKRAHTHEEVRDAFVSIQRALLPERLPTLSGVSVCGVYRPAQAATVIGGDWYAVVPIDDARLAIAIGDAAGSGLPASAQMARVRYALLALARQDVEPGALLTSLNDYLFAIGQDNFVTATYGVLDRDRRLWTESRAGHPPTVVRSTDGGARFLDTHEHPGGLPLGVARNVRYEPKDHKLSDDATLLLYTDGLFERRREDLTVGLERLRRTFESVLIDDPDEACARIADDLAGHDAEDDVALLMTTLEARYADADE
jgi:serine phosphatase RsbU (regulator of sigma subunit)